MRAKVMIAAALLAVAGGSQAKSLAEGDMAPPFTLKLFDGTKVLSTDLRGQVVVLNFWATWCVPCRKELPLLEAYYRVQKSHGLKVYAVTTEDSLPAYRLKPLFQALTIQSGRVAKGPYADLGAVPTNYVIDRSGHIRYMRAGAFDLDALNAVLVPLLKEPAPAPGA